MVLELLWSLRVKLYLKLNLSSYITVLSISFMLAIWSESTNKSGKYDVQKPHEKTVLSCTLVRI